MEEVLQVEEVLQENGKNNLKEMNQNILSENAIMHLEGMIAEIETQTSGEIKVIIAEKSPWWKYGKKEPVKNKAADMFRKYKMGETVDKTGVLVFFSLKEREFYIHADQGIYEKIGPDKLNQLSESLVEKFKTGLYYEGIRDLLNSVSIPLIEYFPIKPGDVNELNNEIIFIK